MNQHSFGIVWFALVGLMLVTLAYQVVRKRGLRGAMFGAPVARTIGELDFGARGGVRTRVRVHRLESHEVGSPQVGLEVLTTAFAGAGIKSIPMTLEQARTLSSFLVEATSR